MSEYQYYDFRAIDAPLDAAAQQALRGISSRASITPTTFANVYNYGGLKADPSKLLAERFDALLHVTNWGTRWLAFRFPRGVLSSEDLAPYQAEVVSVRQEGQHTCLHVLRQDEDARGWLDGDGLLDPLLPIRSALGAGDLRSLYLAWLAGLRDGDLDFESPEPPVPPGLGELDAAHQAFADFIGVDDDLLAAAVEASAPLVAGGASREATLAWVAAQEVAEKDRWILEVLDGGAERLRWRLLRRLRAELGGGDPGAQGRRTCGELLDRAQEIAVERAQRAQRARSERLRKEAAQQAAARKRRLDRLEGQQGELWRQVDELIATLKPKAYDQATALLADLRDLAERAGTREQWEARVAALRVRHERKPSLLRRLDGVAEPREPGQR